MFTTDVLLVQKRVEGGVPITSSQTPNDIFKFLVLSDEQFKGIRFTTM